MHFGVAIGIERADYATVPRGEIGRFDGTIGSLGHRCIFP
jgi:hypothetical protein